MTDLPNRRRAGGMKAERIKQVLQSHPVQCTGPGEVSCGHEDCDGWMSWGKFYQHQADAIIAAAEQEPKLMTGDWPLTPGTLTHDPTDFVCPDCGGTSGPDWNVPTCSTCKGTGMVHAAEQGEQT